MCLGVVDTDITALLVLCSLDGSSKCECIPVYSPSRLTRAVAKLELKSPARVQKGRVAGILSVRLMKEVDAAAMAIELVQRDAGRSVLAVEGLQSSLSSLTSKLEVLVNLGDGISQVMFSFSHPYHFADGNSRYTLTSTLRGRSSLLYTTFGI